ncbi:MAG: radical SAM protein [Candidatus Jordarchaeum sp.]|uniref:radical SAM protein n=1 Tax=Candidatus Jordarchaeum sp. TaxID=2823881 RepID=UPI00404ADEF6
MFIKYTKDNNKCVHCGFCETIVQCPSPDFCIGCEACFHACPEAARKKLVDREPRRKVRIMVNGSEFEVPERITVKKALELLGYRFTRFPREDAFFAPCLTGGCYSCSLVINDALKPSCHTGVEDGMVIQTNVEGRTPFRIVEGFSPHSVGGVGTPYWLKMSVGYIEVAAFTAGCNLRCGTCQNYHVTYNSSGLPLTPREAAANLTYVRKRFRVDRMAISGGEATLNHRWLVEFFKELKLLNRDSKSRLHLDTNATILTEERIDDLMKAGVTDIGPDLKALRVETFQKLTNIEDRELAERYLKTSWEAVEYISDNYYPEKVFMGVGIPYNKFIHPDLDEIYEMGLKIASIDPEIQVCSLDYRPEFRKRDIIQPTPEEMKKVKKTLEAAGLKKVIVQTSRGHIGP